MSLLTKFLDLVSRDRAEITRSWEATPYLTRWVLLGSRTHSSILGRDCGVYLHRFHRSDADEMHDHPWPFTSIILSGGYWEKTPARGWSNGDGPTQQRWYGPGRVLTRPANWIHSVLIPDGREAWTLVIRGAKAKSWGFFCPHTGYTPWREHRANAEATGRGCA
jgi:hypothetical protein